MYSNSSGPPAGYANNFPSFQNCTVCHSGNVNSGNGSIEFSGLPIYYTPGQIYQIEVVVEGTNSRGYGFQATSQVDNIAVGSFALNNNSNYAEINGNYIQQDSRNPSGSWVFDWVAPSTDVGDYNIKLKKIILLLVKNIQLISNMNGLKKSKELH